MPAKIEHGPIKAPTRHKWKNQEELPVRDFTCGYCSLTVASDKGFWTPGTANPIWSAYLCPRCDRPTFFEGDKQFPGVSPVGQVKHLPTQVEEAYEEARACIAANAPTAAALMARKLLMNVAVHKGAPGNKRFVEYVDYLLENFLPEGYRSWVDAIRELGNDATHEIPTIDASRAKSIMTFTKMLLTLVFEYPAEAQGGS